MYADFFGLKRPPFNSTLDSSFFFESPQHGEALASLIYAVQERKGIVVVTGDVGSGKSLVARLLVESLESADVAMVTDSHISGDDLLSAACRQFQIPADPGSNIMECLAALEEFLLTEHAKDRAAVLIIDDAHLLGDRQFEQLRLLANLEVAGGKLLQIVLLGQRELQQQIAGPTCRPLRQRVFRSLHLHALSRDLTAGYIRRRLTAAGSQDAGVFDDEAVDLIHKYSGGLPRLINNLCDNVLLSAFSDDSRRIDDPRVHAVINELASAEPGCVPNDAHGGEGVDHAIEEITERYVRSLEAQVSALDTTSADTDRRIQELNRLSGRLQVQERRLAEQQEDITRKSRDLHKLSATLQEQQHGIEQRERAASDRVELLETLCARLDEQDKTLVGREARMVQQHRDLERLSRTLAEQDQRLTDRAGFIEKKLSSRQVAFDRELNECKRAINRKWQDMKQLVVEHVSRDADWSKRLAAVDLRLRRFETIEPDLARLETKILTTSASVQAEMTNKASSVMASLQEQETRIGAVRTNMEADLAKLEARLFTARDAGTSSVERLTSSQKELDQHISRKQRGLQEVVEQAEQTIQHAERLLDRPQQILEKVDRQVEQVERMGAMVQKASMSLQKTLDASTAGAKTLHASAAKTREELEDLTDDAGHLVEDLGEQTTRTRKLRDVFQQIFTRSEAQMTQLKKAHLETEAFMARVLRQAESLRESSAQPTRLVQELRSVGSAAERNIHEGVTKLSELKTMIDKAERARKSIEALIQATRRVAEARRGASGQPVTVPRRQAAVSPLTDVIADRVQAEPSAPLIQPGGEMSA